MSSDEKAASPSPLADARTTDVFVSYARVDEQFVHKLSTALTSHGKQVWVDRQSILPAAEWLAEIRNGINAAHTLAVELKKRLVSVVCSEVAPR